jgi:hypothetical protein
MSLIALVGIVLVFLLDTGSVAEWIARHKHTKIDEIVFTALALLIVLWLFSTRKWRDLSRFVTRYEESPQPVHSLELNRVRAAQQRADVDDFETVKHPRSIGSHSPQQAAYNRFKIN